MLAPPLLTDLSALAPEARRQRVRADYAAFVHHYFPHYAVAACAPFHLAAAAALRADPRHRAIWQWFRGAAKSTHATVFVPMWLLAQEPPELAFLLLVGKSQADAVRLLSDLRTELAENERYAADFGAQRGPHRSPGAWAGASFRTQGGALFMAKGLGQSPRGLRNRAQRPDYIVADDIDSPALCANPKRVAAAARWVMEDLLGTQDVGRGRFVLAGNLFARPSVQAALLESGAFALHQANALDGEGHPTWPAKYGPAGEWLHARRAALGEAAFLREYMNTPMRPGAVFKEEWIRWAPAQPWVDYDALVCYLDPSYSSGPKADYKAAKLWGRLGPALHHLAAFVRQAPMRALATWCYDLYERVALQGGAAVQFVIEGGFMQHLLADDFAAEGAARGYVLPLRTDARAKPAKTARIEAMSGLWERGAVHYAEALRHCPDTRTGLDQLLAFEPGSRTPDDGPDADEGALWLLRATAATPAPPLIGRRAPRTW